MDVINDGNLQRLKWAAAQLRESAKNNWGNPFGKETEEAVAIIQAWNLQLLNEHKTKTVAAEALKNVVAETTNNTFFEKVLTCVSAAVDYVGTPTAIIIGTVVTVAGAYGFYKLCCPSRQKSA